jgi:hypothetical protein
MFSLWAQEGGVNTFSTSVAHEKGSRVAESTTISVPVQQKRDQVDMDTRHNDLGACKRTWKILRDRVLRRKRCTLLLGNIGVWWMRLGCSKSSWVPIAQAVCYINVQLSW